MPPGADGARAGRKFVSKALAAAGEPGLADDAALAAAELLANAHQHGTPPVVLRVDVRPGWARIEVRDASPRMPVILNPNTANMTGRGLAVVDALCASWGVEPDPTGGKAVWCELSADTAGTPADPLSLDALLGGDEDLPSADQRYTVVLGNLPTSLLIEAKAHIDNLVREFTLAAESPDSHSEAIPADLAQLIETVVHAFSDARASIKRQAAAAAQRNDPYTSLTLHLPLSAADAGERYLAALDKADAYARAARLLTLETPPDHRLFRRWYVQGVIEQLRRLGRGEKPVPLEPFESRLLTEFRALAAAERMADRAARLQRVTAALARARTPEDVASVVLSEAVAALGASGGGLLVPAPDGEHLAVPGAVGYGDKLMGQLREERLDAALPAATALRTGQPVWLESQSERDADFPELRGFEPSTVAMCAVPLVVGSRLLGALRFSFNAVKLFDQAERDFTCAVAALTAQTLHRTETYEAERQVAVDLQRALLPPAITSAPGWEVAAYYSPAGGQEVGGDFYDVFQLPDGRNAAIVGDVMGRGVPAAAAMAEIRSAIRAYIVDDPDPAAVLRRMDAYFAALALDQLVTVAYLLADGDSDLVRVANAGHLPPLLVSAGAAEALPTLDGLPFGAVPDDRIVTTLRLPAGAALVVITDGLVERRGEDIDVGIKRVVDVAAGAQWHSAADLLQSIVDATAGQRGSDDDVTVLVLRRQS